MELNYVYGTAAVMVVYFLVQLMRKRFDPFAPVWLFFVGFLQVYVVQAISYYDWAIRVRGSDLVAAANLRALWALIWFLFVYHSGLGNLASRVLPRPPANWSHGAAAMISPLLVVWGLFCAGMLVRSGDDPTAEASPEAAILRAFPLVMLIAAILLVVSGRAGGQLRPKYLWSGVVVAGLYVLIWMFNGKRSHSLIGVLATICGFYISKLKRPSWPVLFATAGCGLFAVVFAISWRYDRTHERSMSGFVSFLFDFNPNNILRNFNIETEDDAFGPMISKETEEYGGFLLMMDVVPTRSEYDYGANYLRVFSTFIPRVIWLEKPLFGREQWVNAWIVGSELKRGSDFTGPAIGILGATQLNGALGTLIVIGCLAILWRMAYSYFQRYAHLPWVQVFWAITYYNAWFTVVCDDPLIWFYYSYGFTSMPILVFFWFFNKFAPTKTPPPEHVEVTLSASPHQDYSYIST